jgi:hypothetical protein
MESIYGTLSIRRQLYCAKDAPLADEKQYIYQDQVITKAFEVVVIIILRVRLIVLGCEVDHFAYMMSQLAFDDKGTRDYHDGFEERERYPINDF